jgi:uncharacterized membrane protein YeiH
MRVTRGIITRVQELIIETLNFIGLAAFALSGALMAVRRQFDIIGMAVLATITALGGGVIRDLLIGSMPPDALLHTWWLVVPLAATVVTFFFHPQVTRLRRSVAFFDAVGLGLFCSAASVKALSFGLSPLASVMLGVVTGIGGGILRDLLCNEIPAVLRRDSQLYAIPAIVGCTLVVTAIELGAPSTLTVFLGAAFITGFRLLAIWRRWRGPVPAAAHA